MSRAMPSLTRRSRAWRVSTLITASLVVGTITVGVARAAAPTLFSAPEGLATTSVSTAAAAPPITRSTVISRAQAWVSARPNVPYNQTRYYASPTNYYGDAAGHNPSGWREDCSGFVSQAWGIAAPGVVTATMPAVTTPISWGALQPGDALLRYDSTVHHTALFVKWDDTAHTAYTLYEEAGTATGTLVDTGVSITNSYWSTFTPVRYDNITGELANTGPLQHDYNGDTFADVLAEDSSGSLRQYAGNGAGGFASGHSTIGAGLRPQVLFSAGDFTGDGKNDLLARDGSGNMLLYPGSDGTLTTSPSTIGVGWQSMTALVGDGDFTGDGHPDVLARDVNGNLLLYANDGAGRFTSGRTTIGGGWNAMTSLISVGDFTGDGRDDVIARDDAGRLLLYPGTAQGVLGGAVVIGQGWQGMTAILAAGDFTGDHRPDIISRSSTGDLLLYPGAGNGRLTGGRSTIGIGWSALTIVP